MKYLLKLFLFLAPAIFSPLGAMPGTAENIHYKVTLSETLPGLDDQVSLQAGPTITVTIQDKYQNTGYSYPLPVYAIHSYFLTDDTLNLLCRITPRNSQGGVRYSFIQLNPMNSQDSRQFQPFKRYSFSPDNQSLLIVFDGVGQADPVGIIRLEQAPARLGWIYRGALNLFKKALPDLRRDVMVNDPIGWSADSQTAAFVISAPGPTPDSQGQEVWKDYLACVRLDNDGFQILAKPVDLSPYKFRKGSVITDLKCDGDKAVFTFAQSESSDTLKAEILLPQSSQIKQP